MFGPAPDGTRRRYVRRVELGSLAEWVGAVGTVGALLLALSLFARDRALSRRKSADELITWLSWEEVPDRVHGVVEQTTAHILNTGTRPMHAPLLVYRDATSGYATQVLSGDGRPAVLPPNAGTSCVLKRPPRNPDNVYAFVFTADGRLWIRKASEHQYVGRFAGSVLFLLWFCFERADGASRRRRRARRKAETERETPNPAVRR